VGKKQGIPKRGRASTMEKKKQQRGYQQANIIRGSTTIETKELGNDWGVASKGRCTGMSSF